MRLLCIAGLAVMLASLAQAQLSNRTTRPPTSTTTVGVEWSDTSTTLDERIVLRALRRFRWGGTIVTRAASFKGYTREQPENAMLIEARTSNGGIAAFVFFRVTQPPFRTVGDGGEPRVEHICPALWLARVSVARGTNVATIDAANRVDEDVCYDGDDPNGAGPSELSFTMLREEEETAGGFRLRANGHVYHHEEGGVGGRASSFVSYIDVNGAGVITVPISDVQRGRVPDLSTEIAFTDHDADTHRDVVVLQRWQTHYGHDAEECGEDASTRASSLDQVERSEGEHCLFFLRRTVRTWDPALRNYRAPVEITP